MAKPLALRMLGDRGAEHAHAVSAKLAWTNVPGVGCNACVACLAEKIPVNSTGFPGMQLLTDLLAQLLSVAMHALTD